MGAKDWMVKMGETRVHSRLQPISAGYLATSGRDATVKQKIIFMLVKLECKVDKAKIPKRLHWSLCCSADATISPWYVEKYKTCSCAIYKC